MRCVACGKEHPPEKVTWSERNPSQQPRPYHCPQCWQAGRSDKENTYWHTGTVADAENCREHGRHSPASGGCCLG
jgi:DNA-directed RNA polymerase subunit RPC12/RpoP